MSPTASDSDAADASARDHSDGFELYYMSYGSNMSRSKMAARGLVSQPINYTEVYVGRVRDWKLTFDILGLPPIEPVMGSIEHSPDSTLYGVVYKIVSPKDWEALLRSEGVGINPDPAYELLQVEAECYKRETPNELVTLRVHTLRTVAAKRKSDWKECYLFPSKRYMKLLIDGARGEKLPDEYVEFLESIPTARIWGGIPLEIIELGVPFRIFIPFTLGFGSGFLTKTLPVMVYTRYEQIHAKESLSFFDEIASKLLYASLLFLLSLSLFPSLILMACSKRMRNIYLTRRKARLEVATKGSTDSASESSTKTKSL